jgi:hypothetical protein
MHIVLGILGSLISVLYLLDRMGIDLGGLNPFYWRRRRAWAKKYQGDPIYAIEDPMHVAAIFIVGAAKLDGDMSAEQKKVAVGQFETYFSLDSRQASELLGSAAHLLGAPQVIDTQLNGLADKNKERFSRDQAESMLEMMARVASTDGEMSNAQKAYVEKMRAQFTPPLKGDGPWAQ